MNDQLRLSAVGAVMTLLGAFCLGPLFTSDAWVLPADGFAGWLLPAAGAVLAVTAAGHLARRGGVARPLVPLISLLALFLYCVLAFAREQAVYGLLPGPAAIGALVDRVLLANTEILQYAAPIAPLPGVTFLTVVGVGGTALLVDTLAVTYRRVALAGVPLLGFYAVPLLVTAQGAPWTTFSLAAAGYLALLVTDARERVGGWGRPLQPGDRSRSAQDGPVETGPLAQLGRRVGVAVIGLAVVLPFLAPDIGQGLLGGYGRGGGGGPSTVTVVNPILSLGDDLRRPEDREVLTYDTTGGGTYLRIVALDEFDGDTWQASELEVGREQNVVDGLPFPTGLSAEVLAEPVTTAISVGPLNQQYLPVPFAAQQIDIAGEWLYDVPTDNIFSSDEDVTTFQRDYTVDHLDVQPTAEELRAAETPETGFAEYLELPADLPTIVGETAVAVVQDAPTPFDQALALQTFFRSSAFTYTLDAPDDSGGEATADFLEQRRGYCVQFASAMALMARELGIPARVAVGFTPGRGVGDGQFIVGTHDAHAWPELYLPGAGWLAFEPTPAARTGLPPEYARISVELSDDSVAEPEPDAVTAAPVPLPPDRIPEGEQAGGSIGSPLSALTGLPLVPTLGVLGVLVALTAPALIGRLATRRRWSAATRRAGGAGQGSAGTDPTTGVALAAWAEVQATVRDLREPWPTSETPRRSAQRLSSAFGLGIAASAALRRLSRAVERARYGRPEETLSGDGEPTAGELERRARRDAAMVRQAMLRHSSRGARLRARLLPGAAGDLVTSVGATMADAIEALDRAVSTVGRRLSPARRG